MTEHVKVDWQFVDSQLKFSDLSHDQAVLVRKLLHSLEFAGVTPDDLDTLESVFEATRALLNSEALLVDLRSEKWVDALPGDIVKRDRVRVKPDAYTGTAGTRHNGRRGRVVSLRNGKAAVVYDGESADGAPQHEINALQKLV